MTPLRCCAGGSFIARARLSTGPATRGAHRDCGRPLAKVLSFITGAVFSARSTRGLRHSPTQRAPRVKIVPTERPAHASEVEHGRTRTPPSTAARDHRTRPDSRPRARRRRAQIDAVCHESRQPGVPRVRGVVVIVASSTVWMTRSSSPPSSSTRRRARWSTRARRSPGRPTSASPPSRLDALAAANLTPEARAGGLLVSGDAFAPATREQA